MRTNFLAMQPSHSSLLPMDEYRLGRTSRLRENEFAGALRRAPEQNATQTETGSVQRAYAAQDRLGQGISSPAADGYRASVLQILDYSHSSEHGQGNLDNSTPRHPDRRASFLDNSAAAEFSSSLTNIQGASIANRSSLNDTIRKAPLPQAQRGTAIINTAALRAQNRSQAHQTGRGREQRTSDADVH